MHPGYGFLAENPEFAEACAKAGLTFIGPTPRRCGLMGSKTNAREVAIGGGRACRSAAAIRYPTIVGYPMLVKAVAGGGGKGMRVVRAAERARERGSPGALGGAVIVRRRRVYFERLLERPRHIEVQLLGDTHGAIVPFVERECSIQRRHQKLIEETPSPVVTPALRARLMAAAAAIGHAANYTSAGTIEFLLDGNGEFYFLEMNTRLQVEHPVTEAVTGVDFVRAQIEIAIGARLADLKAGTTNGAVSDSSGAVPTFKSANGHAIEVRVYAENPDEGFLPSPGRITHLRDAVGARHSRRQRGLRRVDGADCVRPVDLESRGMGARPSGSHRADGSRID